MTETACSDYEKAPCLASEVLASKHRWHIYCFACNKLQLLDSQGSLLSNKLRGSSTLAVEADTCSYLCSRGLALFLPVNSSRRAQHLLTHSSAAQAHTCLHSRSYLDYSAAMPGTRSFNGFTGGLGAFAGQKRPPPSELSEDEANEKRLKRLEKNSAVRTALEGQEETCCESGGWESARECRKRKKQHVQSLQADMCIDDERLLSRTSLTTAAVVLAVFHVRWCSSAVPRVVVPSFERRRNAEFCCYSMLCHHHILKNKQTLQMILTHSAFASYMLYAYTNNIGYNGITRGSKPGAEAEAACW
eukprot:16185-Heterococcus_DN1.PRE.2